MHGSVSAIAPNAPGRAAITRPRPTIESINTHRYVVLGAGAIGAGIGGRLHESGHDVVLIARGPHLAAITRAGLILASRDRESTLAVPAVATAADVRWRPDDTVILAVKSQDTTDALRTLALHAPATTPIVCAQNGVTNEPGALRWFGNVYGLSLQMPAVFLEPGRIFLRSSPVSGLFDLGRYPHGIDAIVTGVTGDLSASTFVCRPVADVMRFNYRKLLRNLNNAVLAAVGSAGHPPLAVTLRDEALAVFAAAGIEIATDEEDGGRRESVMTRDANPRFGDTGSSSWQSLARHRLDRSRLPQQRDCQRGDCAPRPASPGPGAGDRSASARRELACACVCRAGIDVGDRTRATD